MKTKAISVGSFEAKTHLSELLDKVRDGTEIIITRRGKPIARLIPYKENKKTKSRKELILKFTEIRNYVKGSVNIKDFIEEGRKY